MQDATLSPWFSLDEQKPWEPGVYEIQSAHQPDILGLFSYFDGHEFQYIKRDVDSAFHNRNWSTAAHVIRWRGLSSDPSPKPNPKPRGNPKVTRYVVMTSVSERTVAIFENVAAAREYADRVNFPVRVKKIRFRSSEASKK